MTDLTPLAPLADALFPGLDLGDARRDRRFARVVQALARDAGQSLPQLFPTPADYAAALRLFDAPECSHANVLAAHQIGVLDALERRTGTVLLLHDATVLDFSGHTTLADDLGPIGNGGGRGWLAHQTLAVDPDTRLALGLVSQILHVRPASTKGESVAARRARLDRESRLWVRGIDEVGPVPAGCHWVDVCDRGADAFEFLQALVDRRRRYIVRSCHNRAVGDGPSDAKAPAKLHDALRALPATASWTLDQPAKTGRPRRSVRMAGASLTTTVRPPHVRKGESRREAVAVTAVRVWEVDPAGGGEALEWFVLTNEPAGTPAEIERVARWYACRMQIEEFHKVQKSGASVEGCQVQSVEKMAALVAVLSVISVAMLNLRLSARTPALAGLPAESVVPRAWVEVLSRMQSGRVASYTVAEFWVELARAGGYMKNPKKHPPGWITLWRGWTRFHTILRYELSRAEMC